MAAYLFSSEYEILGVLTPNLVVHGLRQMC